MISIIHKSEHFNFERGVKTEMITVAGTFEEVGYGYVGVKTSKESINTTLISVDPR